MSSSPAAPPSRVRSRTVAIPRPKRFRRLKRFLLVLLMVAGLSAAGVAYLIHTYGPGLEAEARTIPDRVQTGLATQGAPYTPLSQISLYLREAIVSIEDRRFYEHPGVDPIGLARSLWLNLTEKHIDQGGSTLEEQLAKLTIVHDDRPFHSKLRSMALAWAIDQEFSKARVLALYLNAAYFGQGAYGAGEAARIYFGVDASQLTLPQAAFLAALPQAPSIYGSHPTSNVVVGRWHTVLHDMASSGYISGSQVLQAENTVLVFATGSS